MNAEVATERVVEHEPSFALTPDEEELFGFLRACSSYATTKQRAHNKEVIVRVSGGWVRDKLIGRESNDIDVVVDTLHGAEFARCVVDYDSHHSSKRVVHSRLIQMKREVSKCKHVATTSLRLFDYSVDFLHLRSWNVDQDDEIGTPESDAMARDFTINALYYNLNTNKVEDYTKRGLRDIQRRVLSAVSTNAIDIFVYDPLRAIRAVRFASAMNLTIDEDLLKAMKQPNTRDDLLNKITRPRIEQEMKKVFSKSLNVILTALELLSSCELIPSVFPLQGSSVEKTSVSWNDCPQRIELGLKVTRNVCSRWTQLDVDEMKALLHACLFSSLAHDLSTSVPFKMIPFTKYFIREEWRYSSKDCDAIMLLMKGCYDLNVFLDSYLREHRLNRGDIGMTLREVGPKWSECIDIIKEARVLLRPQQKDLEESNVSQFVKYLEESNLVGRDRDNAWHLTPLFTGKELKQMFHIKGKEVGLLMTDIIRWQLNNPEKNKEECKLWLNTAH